MCTRVLILMYQAHVLAKSTQDTETRASLTHNHAQKQQSLHYLPVVVVDHDVVWLDVSVHHSHTVAVVEGT